MSVPSAELLRALGGGIRPTGVADAPPSARPDTPAFADLLAKARAGEVSSDLPVTVAQGAGVSLSDDQLRRLAVAADRAEAAGLSRALVLIDGRSLALDVGVRQITGAVELAPGAALPGIDGIVQAPAPASDQGPTLTALSHGPAHGALNASLIKALSRSPDGAGRGAAVPADA